MNAKKASDERLQALAEKEQLDLTDWIEITGIGIGNDEELRYCISTEGIRFVGWPDDLIGISPPLEQAMMIRQNNAPGLRFPCSPNELVDFVDSESGSMFGSLHVPDSFRDAVTGAHAEGAQDDRQSGESVMSDDEAEQEQPVRVATDALAALFDPVTPAALEKMFPASGGWKKWHKKAKEKGLDVARVGRGTYNPYLAALWWLEKQAPDDWTLGRCLKRLATNLPPRSHGQEYRLTGKSEWESE